ncbi:hypothetical protein ACJ72_04884 [Emergomyces africanus]|uniref:Uncharacterized protein n=1 Tax=Emergomyces africanus TaxID=1955775 RepID=A0A1B7NVI2_9EURO|nr:hypothetical protein ACJ72_04884 [Emergomyces africanus]
MEFIHLPKDVSLVPVARNRDQPSEASSLLVVSSTQPCVSSRKMNNPSKPPTWNSMHHNSVTGSVIPIYTTSRASAPPLPTRQTLGFAQWSHGEGNVRSATYSPPVASGCATSLLAARSGLPSSGASYTRFGGQQQTPKPFSTTTGVVGGSLGNHGGGTGPFIAPVTTASMLLPLYPQPHASQDRTGIVGMLGRSVDGKGGSPLFEYRGGVDKVDVEEEEEEEAEDEGENGDDKEGDDDVLSAAAAAAIELPQRPKFGNLDVDDIDLNVVIFYFGVLSVVTGLRPNFSYERTAEGNWRAYLTYWDMTLSSDGVFEDKFVAKAETCRAALEGLKERYSGWILPEIPGVQVELGSWIWTALLQEYCEQNKLPRPTYTKYLHEDGFRYGVDVGGTCYFGADKFYKSVTEAIHASAHAALYGLLLTGHEVMSLFRGVGFAGGLLTNSINNEAATARLNKSSIQSQERPLRCYCWGFPAPLTFSGTNFTKQITEAMRKRQVGRKRVLSGDPGVSPGISNVPNEPRALLLKPGLAKKGCKRSRKAQKQAKRGNANLFPIPAKNRRLPAVEEAPSSKMKGQKISSRDLELMTKQYWNPEPPEYQIDPLQELEGGIASLFSAAARFPNDPFLARAGNIGRSKFVDSMQMAKEKCAARVVDYLIQMVKEDEEWEDPEEDPEENVRRWEGMACIAAAAAADNTTTTTTTSTYHW